MATISDKIAKQLEEIENRANKEIDALAEQYFESTVVPFCKENDLTFMNAMGMIVFHNEKYDLGFYGDGADDIPDVNEDLLELDEDDLHPSEKYALEHPLAKEKLKEIFDVLNIIVFRFEFGFSFPDFQE
jgi:hypothetical protein